MNLESPKVRVSKNQQELFAYLTNVENYKELMPESLVKFEKIDDASFAFQLKGMPEIQLQITDTQEPSSITLGSMSKSLDFSLNIAIEPVDENNSEAQLFFNGKFNAMMSMMVKKPLSNFITTLSSNLKNKSF